MDRQIKIYEYADGCGISKAKSGQTKINPKKNLNCDNCGISIQRYPSQCRGKTKACSPSCAAELRKVRVGSKCVICGNYFYTTPACVGKLVTCSNECRKARKVADGFRRAPRFTDAILTIKEIQRMTGLTRGQIRYRQAKGIEITASLKKEVRVTDGENTWPSISECARSLGVSTSAVDAGISKGWKVKGRRICREVTTDGTG